MLVQAPQRRRLLEPVTGGWLALPPRCLLPARCRGPAAVNIDSVAGRSGVARTTIYRRYRSRAELMAAVLDALVEAPLPAPELSVAEKLRWVLEQVSDVFDSGLGRGGTAAVLADSDPEFTAALRTRLADRLHPLSEMMAADIMTRAAPWPGRALPT